MVGDGRTAATALDRLPLPAGRLQSLLQSELRVLFESLQLQIGFQPETRTIDVEVALVADEPPDRDGEASQVWSVPPAGFEPAHRAPEARALSSELRGLGGRLRLRAW